MSAMLTTLVPRGHELVEPGSYRFRGIVEAKYLVGDVDVVVSVIDEDRQVVLAEVWEQGVIGAPEPGAHLTFDPGFSWSLDRMGSG